MNTETKHTPGPWKFLFEQTPETIEELIVPANPDHGLPFGWKSKSITIGGEKNEVLAEVKAYTTSGFLQDFNQWKANAKLIAAAPELLEALQEVIKISDRKHDAWDKAKAAIKKATE